MSFILEALKKADHTRTLGIVPDVHTNHQPRSPVDVGKAPAWPYLMAAILFLNAGLIGWWLHPWSNEKKPAAVIQKKVEAKPVAVIPSSPKKVKDDVTANRRSVPVKSSPIKQSKVAVSKVTSKRGAAHVKKPPQAASQPVAKPRLDPKKRIAVKPKPPAPSKKIVAKPAVTPKVKAAIDSFPAPPPVKPQKVARSVEKSQKTAQKLGLPAEKEKELVKKPVAKKSAPLSFPEPIKKISKPLPAKAPAPPPVHKESVEKFAKANKIQAQKEMPPPGLG